MAPRSRQSGDPVPPRLVRALRQKHQLTQEELARRLGVRGGKSVISGWENGRSACDGPAAELLLRLLGEGAGDPEAAALTLLIEAMEAEWRRAGNYLPSWRQTAVLPVGAPPVDGKVFKSLFPGAELPNRQHAHGFPSLHGLASRVYRLMANQWLGVIPASRQSPPRYLWMLGREGAFAYREPLWEDDPLSVTEGHIHIGSLLECTASTVFFLRRLAARADWQNELPIILRLDLEGISERGLIAYVPGRLITDFALGDPGAPCGESHLSASIQTTIGALHEEPLGAVFGWVAEVASRLGRPDLIGADALEEQLLRRHRQDLEGGAIRFLGFLDERLGARGPRRALVHLDGHRAGVIEETPRGSRFTYDADYLARADAVPIAITLPLDRHPFESPGLHPFFDNLLPEGSQLALTEKQLKISKDDRFGLLLATCRDTIGAVEIIPDTEDSRHRDAA